VVLWTKERESSHLHAQPSALDHSARGLDAIHDEHISLRSLSAAIARAMGGGAIG
jgi:hypothetical protein